MATSLSACGLGAIPRLGLANDGAVAVAVAICMTVLIYGVAVALDLANVYYNKSFDQRVADQSAIAAAFTYASTGSTATAATAASSLALANGVPSASDVTTTIGPSPIGDGRQAAEVVISAPVPLTGAGRMITSTSTQPGGQSSVLVGATAWAEIHEGSPCILALKSPGFTMNGGQKVNATNCSVVSDNVVGISNGASLTASTIQAVGSITNTNGTISGPKYPNSSTTADPYASSNVFARLPTVLAEGESAPIFPSIPSAPAGGTAQYCYSGTLTLAGNSSYGSITAGSGCSAIVFSGGGTTSTLGINCTGGALSISFAPGTYKLGGLSMSTYGAVTATLTGTPTIYIYGSLQMYDDPITFNGTANWYITGGLIDDDASTVTFSNSGSTTSNFTVGYIDLENGPISFPNGTYTITGSGTHTGLTANATTATFGEGSFIIEDGIYLDGGKTLTFGNPLSTSSVFEVFGSTQGTSCAGTAIATLGGSTLSTGAFPYTDICGEFLGEGNLYLGQSAYTIYGELDFAASGGSTITGSSVSLIASGAVLFGAGYSAITLDAPTGITSSTEGGTQTVAIASSTTATSTVDAGATNTDIQGLVYLPNSPLVLDGGGDLNGGGNCLQVIASSIVFSGGAQLATNCSSLGTGAANGAVTLVE